MTHLSIGSGRGTNPRVKPLLISALCSLLPALAANAAITGTLIDEQAKPVAGATIRAYASEEWKSIAKRLLTGAVERPVLATAQSGENGSFKLEAKSPLVDVVIEANGKQTRAVEAPDSEELNIIVMRAAKARKIRLVSGNKPVANAIVAAGPIIARSDAEGMVDFPQSPTRVFIVHPDFTPMSDFSGGEAETKELSLSRGVAVKGRVLAEDGQPVANATVSISGWPMAETAADGSFSIAHAPANWRTIRATDATRAGTANNIRANSYDIKLLPAARIAGTTQPGTRVYFDTPGGEAELADNVIADAQGKFSATLAPRAYNVRTSRAGYQLSRAEVVFKKGEAATRNLTLKPLNVVRGRVLDEQKQPVEGAFVWSSFGGSIPTFGLVRTGAGGEFTARYSGEAVMNTLPRVLAAKSGYATSSTSVSASPVTITLERGFPLEVRVVDRQAKRVANATVMMSEGDENTFGARIEAACEQLLVATCRTTDDSGAIHLRATPGTFMSSVRGDSIVSKMQARQQLTASSSPLTLEVDRGVEVTGRVAYTDRSPAFDAMVMSRGFGPGSSTHTDADGFFTLRNVLPGKLTLVASDSSRIESTPLEVEAPARGIAITIPSPARIEGRVVDKETNAPVTDFQVGVVLRQPGGGNSTGSPLNFHSEDGTFVIDRVTPRTIDLVVMASGYARGTLNNLATEEGKTLRAQDIQLEKGGTIRGRVTAGGQPLSGVTVRADARGPMIMFRGPMGLTTDENGEFVLDSLAAGEQTVGFEKQSYVSRRKSVEVVKGKEARLDVELEKGSTLTGRVVDKNGAAISGARVSFRVNGPMMGMRPVSSDASGNFTIEGLADGKYNVQATKEGFVESVVNDVAVPATSPLTLTLDSGGTLTGRVIGLSPAELVAVEVSAGSRGTNARGIVGSDGTFTLKGVPDGRVTVTAWLRSPGRQRQSIPQTVEVVGGAGPSVQIDFNEGLVVTGRVMKSGQPVTQGSVSFNGAKGNRFSQIGPDGSYTMDGLLAGDYSVNVYGPGGSLYRGKYSVQSNSTFDITIEGATLRGRVVDAASGAPLSDVTVMTIGAKTNPVPRQAVTDSAGQFTLDAVPDGPIELRASPRSKYAMQSKTITVTNGASSEVEFRLESVQSTTFRVTDASTGAPVEPMITIMSGNKSIGGSGGPRDDDGAVRIYVPSGSYTARIWARGYANESVNFTAPASEVRVALQAAGKVIIVASRPTRVRLVSASVSPGVATGGPMATPDGLTLDNLRAGAYRIDVIGDDKTVLRSVPVTVVSGQTVTIRVD